MVRLRPYPLGTLPFLTRSCIWRTKMNPQRNFRYGFIRSVLTNSFISFRRSTEASAFERKDSRAIILSSSGKPDSLSFSISSEAASAAAVNAFMASPKLARRRKDTPRSNHSKADPGVLDSLQYVISLYQPGESHECHGKDTCRNESNRNTLERLRNLVKSYLLTKTCEKNHGQAEAERGGESKHY